MYFTQDYRERIGNIIFDAINKMNKEEAIDCLNALVEVAKKELTFDVNDDYKYINSYVYNNLQYFEKIKQCAESIIARIDNPNYMNKETNKSHQLLLLYLKSGITAIDYSYARVLLDSTPKKMLQKPNTIEEKN